jgi:hypothetical protein
MRKYYEKFRRIDPQVGDVYNAAINGLNIATTHIECVEQEISLMAPAHTE